MTYVYEELKRALDDYFENKSREQLLKDLIDYNCLKVLVEGRNIREEGYFYGVVSYFSHKGFGFIISESGDKHFVFWSNIKNKGFKTLEEKQKVKFKVKNSPRGLEAIEVEEISNDFELKFEVNEEGY